MGGGRRQGRYYVTSSFGHTGFFAVLCRALYNQALHFQFRAYAVLQSLQRSLRADR